MPIKPTVLKVYMINEDNGERTDVTKELPSILFDAIHECSKRIHSMENKDDIIFRIIGSKGDYVVDIDVVDIDRGFAERYWEIFGEVESEFED